MKLNALNLLSQNLTKILTSKLPLLADNWWQSLIIDKLTYQQQNRLREYGYQAIEQLDLAALLRVVDQNWYDLNTVINCSKETRNWLKEAQAIRNRWAHAPAEGLPDDMCYRDLDTIERLLQAFQADVETLEQIKLEKKHVLSKIAVTEISLQKPQTEAIQYALKPGDMIRLKAEPNKTGAIIKLLSAEPENRYQVFHDGNLNTYYQSQIELLATPSARKVVSSTELNAAMTALQLRHPSTTHLYSLFASRINFVPYQFRPVLKLIQADRPRILIADEVGVGKTIEAGLILGGVLKMDRR